MHIALHLDLHSICGLSVTRQRRVACVSVCPPVSAQELHAHVHVHVHVCLHVDWHLRRVCRRQAILLHVPRPRCRCECVLPLRVSPFVSDLLLELTDLRARRLVRSDSLGLVRRLKRVERILAKGRVRRRQLQLQRAPLRIEGKRLTGVLARLLLSGLSGLQMLRSGGPRHCRCDYGAAAVTEHADTAVTILHLVCGASCLAAQGTHLRLRLYQLLAQLVQLVIRSREAYSPPASVFDPGLEGLRLVQRHAIVLLSCTRHLDGLL
eukprot:scaffold49682_cov72-Phaeocystis_antarctica.AAC.2